MREILIYKNGEFIPLSEPAISVRDRGFLYGDGIFDACSAWRGVIFKLDQHIHRMFESLRAARLTTRMTHDDWRDAIIETVRRNELQDANIRFFVTRGESDLPPDPRVYEPTTIIWATPYYFLGGEKARERTIRVMISSLRGFTPDSVDPRYKSLNRLHFQLARLEALDAGYDDAILLSHQGYIGETWAANVFIVKEGALYTPVTHVLPGITRETVLELASRQAIEAREVDITVHQLLSADEVFTATTAGGILGVGEVSGRRIGSGARGPVTTTLAEAYWRMREAGEYGTPV